jgi:hypothetical protein
MDTGDPNSVPDAEIYPQLARVNLLRLRGEYKAAEDLCLSLLRRLPNNPTAHAMLGDLFVEQNKLEDAAHWYELAADLDPSPGPIRRKMAAVREQMHFRDVATSAEQLGLPLRGPKTGLYAGIALALVFGVSLAAFWFGRQSQQKVRTPAEVSTPIEAPDFTRTPPNPVVEGEEAPRTSEEPVRIAQVDREIQALLVQRSGLGGEVISAQSDPRSKIVTITYRARDEADARRSGAELAKTVLQESTEPVMVTLRAVIGDKVAYMADVPRSRYAETQTPDWPAEPADGWISHVLTNEWPVVTPPEPADGGTGTLEEPPSPEDAVRPASP